LTFDLLRRITLRIQDILETKVLCGNYDSDVDVLLIPTIRVLTAARSNTNTPSGQKYPDIPIVKDG
jgi:hypothetical protein